MEKQSLSSKAVSQPALCSRGRHCLPGMFPTHKGTGAGSDKQNPEGPLGTVFQQGNIQVSFSQNCIMNYHSSPISSFFYTSQVKDAEPDFIKKKKKTKTKMGENTKHQQGCKVDLSYVAGGNVK